MAGKDFLNIGIGIVRKEAESLIELEKLMKTEYYEEQFNKAIDILYNCTGKVIVTGVGKSGHIGGKIAATLSSTGTPAFFLNPAEGVHGDIGVIMEGDVLIAISKSGETEELLNILSYPKRLGVPIIAITTNKYSSLTEIADVVLLLPDVDEVCPMNLAPTTSTTLTLVLGDALAVSLMEKRGFREEHFALLHPAGSLGRKLKKVYEIMTPVNEFAVASDDLTIKDVLKLIVEKNKGLCVFIDKDKNITGILTDGDLKRLLLKVDNLLDKKANEVMIKNPKTIKKDAFALEALKLMEGKYTQLVVIDDNKKLCGVIHIHDILKGKVV